MRRMCRVADQDAPMLACAGRQLAPPPYDELHCSSCHKLLAMPLPAGPRQTARSRRTRPRRCRWRRSCRRAPTGGAGPPPAGCCTQVGLLAGVAAKLRERRHDGLRGNACLNSRAS